MDGTQNVSNFNSIYRVFKIGDGDGGERTGGDCHPSFLIIWVSWLDLGGWFFFFKGHRHSRYWTFQCEEPQVLANGKTLAQVLSKDNKGHFP